MHVRPTDDEVVEIQVSGGFPFLVDNTVTVLADGLW